MGEIAGGFAFYIDKIRELNNYLSNKQHSSSVKILVVFGPKSSIERALEAQKNLHKKGYIAILELETCKNENEATMLLNKRGCNRLEWIN